MSKRRVITCMLFLGLSPAWTAAVAPPANPPAGSPSSCPVDGFDRATSPTQAAQAIACDVDGRQLLIVGDYHGSNEIPDFVGQLMSAASARRPVRLGLEIESFEREPIRIYMVSKGTAADRAALLHDDFWTVDEGRTSQAIVRLIERARELRAEGRDVEVFTTVPEYPGGTAVKEAGGVNAYRSAGMAQAIHSKVQHGAALVIAFMGNAHSAYVGPARGSETTVTERLLSDSPYSVNLDLRGGSAWGCASGSCGPHALVVKATPAKKGGVLRKAQNRSGQPTQVWVRFSLLTPSPPAKQKSHS
jgi:hypothetical protein